MALLATSFHAGILLGLPFYHEDGVDMFSETSVDIKLTTRCYIPEDSAYRRWAKYLSESFLTFMFQRLATFQAESDSASTNLYTGTNHTLWLWLWGQQLLVFTRYICACMGEIDLCTFDILIPVCTWIRWSHAFLNQQGDYKTVIRQYTCSWACWVLGNISKWEKNS
jgi:hypothetical protein